MRLYSTRSLLPVSLVRALLENRNAGDEEEADCHQQGTEYCHPASTRQNHGTDDERAPPERNLAEIVRVSGQFPETDTAPLSIVLGVVPKRELVSVCDCLAK